MPSGSFSADGNIIDRGFSARAIIVGNHLRHHRSRDHSGTQDDTTVVLSTAIGQYAAGTTVHDVLKSLWNRINALGSANIRVSSFHVDAFIQPCFRANAVLFKAQSGSFAADAWVAMGSTFTADVVIKRNQASAFTADAALI